MNLCKLLLLTLLIAETLELFIDAELLAEAELLNCL